MKTWTVHIPFDIVADTHKEAVEKAREFAKTQTFGKPLGLSVSVHPSSDPPDKRDWKV